SPSTTSALSKFALDNHEVGAGLGKTQTARQFKACFPNVFYASMKPSTAGVNTMQIEVLKAMGERSPKGTPQALSQRVVEIARNSHLPLLIIDEAQHLSEKAVEEIRSWNDEAGLGIALFGNIKVLKRIEGGGRDDAFAQLYSRLSMRMVRPLPLKADAVALAQAWQIFDDALTNEVVRIAQYPGGLRGATMSLEIASMIAASERRPLQVDDLKSAWVQLSTRGGAA
ncbi:MAG: AAA family ATPase, partial [Novosphingobium sp.]|nr:AAA family ATPase [Novosphingobium sp.]